VREIDLGTHEAEDKEIKVEEIMGKIRENISKRKNLTTGNDSGSSSEFQESLSGFPDEDSEAYNLQNELSYLSSNWKMENDSYTISSHRPFLGIFLVKGRGLVQGEFRRYIDPVILKQSDFNKTTAYVLNKILPGAKLEIRREINRQIEVLRPELHEGLNAELSSEINEKINEEIENLKAEVNSEVASGIDSLKLEARKKIDEEARSLKPSIHKDVGQILNSFISAMDAEINNKIWLRRILDEKIEESSRLQKIKSAEPEEQEELGINYFEFEERFRGSCEDIKGRQTRFLKYFENCSNVLDIGCGRGEFLELLKERGIGGKGVDLDDDMIEQCKLKGLSVELNDALSYLEKLPDGALDGIFIDQVVEHLKPSYLTRLLRLCYQKLTPGHYILIETVNPLSLFSFANFYIDLTHIKPVHPETLKFLLESTGFTALETYFISPVSEEARLQKLPIFKGAGSKEKLMTEIYNQNIDILNNRLFGPQDYAVIGKK
jgi:O-antigen chain-terminating methyltransferase